MVGVVARGVARGLVGQQEAFDVVDASAQQADFVDAVADGAAGAGADVVGAFGCDVEGDGDGDLGLVEVGDVQDEGQFVAGVDEAEAGCAAEGGDGRLGDAVHALGRGGDGLVDGVAGVEVAGDVVAPVPGDADSFGLRSGSSSLTRRPSRPRSSCRVRPAGPRRGSASGTSRVPRPGGCGDWPTRWPGLRPMRRSG